MILFTSLIFSTMMGARSPALAGPIEIGTGDLAEARPGELLSTGGLYMCSAVFIHCPDTVYGIHALPTSRETRHAYFANNTARRLKALLAKVGVHPSNCFASINAGTRKDLEVLSSSLNRIGVRIKQAHHNLGIDEQVEQGLIKDDSERRPRRATYNSSSWEMKVTWDEP